MHEAIQALSVTRRDILLHLKHSGGATIAELATHLGISDEGTRQHLIYLERNGWITRRDAKDTSGRSGRPASSYHVSPDGEAFFPKKYDELAIALIDSVLELHGPKAVEAALTRIADAKAGEWMAKLKGKSLPEKLEMLKDYYQAGDEFTTVQRGGDTSIIERNCPYLDVALKRPALCSVTVNVLSRLLGYEVRRRQTFQRGDSCCEFEVLTDRPIDVEHFQFALEPAIAGREDD